MNRLILIGNGFDLAHGLKTSYKDFIYWYIKKCFIEANNNQSYEDRLIQINYNPNYGGPVKHNESILLEWVESYLENFETSTTKNVAIIGRAYEPNRKDPFIINFKSNLIKALLENSYMSRWIDIEGEFYEKLKFIVRKMDKQFRNNALRDLNESLEFIIEQLELYLATLPPAPYLDGYLKILTSEIDVDDIFNGKTEPFSIPDETYVVTFNYTNTLDSYLKKISEYPHRSVPKVNYIHGKLGDKSKSLVFGFGDESDLAYREMEDDYNIKGYFHYMKSFWYLRTSNYRELMNFINKEEFQIFVLGHSCGLSDRTMLQMIFEHPMCKSIRLYYHGEEDNFVSLTHEVSRHFREKADIRLKVVPLDRSERMPQSIFVGGS